MSEYEDYRAARVVVVVLLLGVAFAGRWWGTLGQVVAHNTFAVVGILILAYLIGSDPLPSPGRTRNVLTIVVALFAGTLITY